MSVILKLSTTRYLDDKLAVKKVMSHLETLCGTPGGYDLGEPEEKAGWAFFEMRIGPELCDSIEKEFSEMIRKYRWSSKEEKFVRFMADYLKARGCGVRVT